MSKRIIHLSLDIKGSLRNPEILKGAITYNGKTLNTVKEIKAFLQYQLSLGRKFLPMCDCDYCPNCGAKMDGDGN